MPPHPASLANTRTARRNLSAARATGMGDCHAYQSPELEPTQLLPQRIAPPFEGD